jgi:transposase-like protein
MEPITDIKNLSKFLDYFKEEGTCRQYLEEMRWDGKVKCPHCNCDHKIYRTKIGFTCGSPECGKKFTVTVGTVMENTKLTIHDWFIAIYLLTSQKSGISSYQLAHHLGITQKTAWHLAHRIRQAFKERFFEKWEGIIQSDETFVGGKNKNRHRDKKVEKSQGRSFKDKTPVLGLILTSAEHTQVRMFVIPSTEASVIQPILEDNIQAGSILMTDEWKAYNGAHKVFQHSKVDHSRKEYVNGSITTNAIENQWSHFKRRIIGVYYHLTRKHLQRYCDEFTYRNNYKKLKIAGMFNLLLERLEGRLTWKQLTARAA